MTGVGAGRWPVAGCPAAALFWYRSAGLKGGSHGWDLAADGVPDLDGARPGPGGRGVFVGWRPGWRRLRTGHHDCRPGYDCRSDDDHCGPCHHDCGSRHDDRGSGHDHDHDGPDRAAWNHGRVQRRRRIPLLRGGGHPHRRQLRPARRAWAHAWLANRFGADHLVDVMLPRVDDLGWEGALANAYHMSSSTFYDEFEVFLALPIADQMAILP